MEHENEDLKYFPYVIENPEHKLYIWFSCAKTPKYNAIYVLNRYSKDKKGYEKLKASFAQYGLKKHKYYKIKFDKTDKPSVEQYVYEKLLSLDSDQILNDAVISPEREQCSGCGVNVRKALMSNHKVYCEGVEFDQIFDI